jgi:hypothetical protein
MRMFVTLILGLVASSAMAIVALPGAVRGGVCWNAEREGRNPITSVCLHEVTGEKGSRYISYSKGGETTVYAKAQGHVISKRGKDGSVEVDKHVYTGYALETAGFPIERQIQLEGKFNADETEMTEARLLVNGSSAIGGLTLTPPIEIESVQSTK